MREEEMELSRIIKFRAWRDPVMLYWRDICARDTAKIFKECQIMQFTGLLDMDGREIYEGDILENVRYDYSGPFRVEWGGVEDYCGFVLINLKNGYRNLFLSKNFENCKVSGNIFQKNP